LDEFVHRTLTKNPSAEDEISIDKIIHHLPSKFSLKIILILILLIVIQTFLPGCQANEKTISLAFLGDIMVGRGVTLESNSLTTITPILLKADLALANLESPLTSEPPIPGGGFNLCAFPENANVFHATGLDILAINNNHSLDCGIKGRQETITNLQKSGIEAIDPQGYTTTINDFKLAFFAFNDIDSPVDIGKAVDLIHSKHADGYKVIVSIHWGMEYQAGESDRQHLLAAEFAKAGADIIWGHHPHVLQPVEWLPGECSNSADKTSCSLVIYSLGNALFDQEGLADTRRSAVLTIILNEKGVIDIQATPFLIDPVHSSLRIPDELTSALILARLHLP
jgi:poly-gamma-glutamate synthesis protein (capsule biosynthesis protein)